MCSTSAPLQGCRRSPHFAKLKNLELSSTISKHVVYIDFSLFKYTHDPIFTIILIENEWGYYFKAVRFVNIQIETEDYV